jgi:small subunit ribosomal protein S9
MDTVVHKIGRRKTSVARIYLKKGKGNFTVNTKDWKDYFPTSAHQFKINQPFNLCNNVNKFDMTVNVYGGGMTGQVEAIRLAISRALCEPLGLLTRDPRMVERKKFGQKKARKKFQFSKR